MTAHSEEPWTLNEVVAYNIKQLRASRRWKATELAEKLSTVLKRKYTRFTVADLEGRREREIRWVELVALCSIFDAPLSRLVLPPEGVQVPARIPTTEGITLTSDDPRMADLDVGESVSLALDRDGMAIRVFGLTAYEIDSKQMHEKWDDPQRGRSVDFLAFAEALRPIIQAEIQAAREETKS